MNDDHKLDRLLAQANPLTEAEIVDWNLTVPFNDLSEAIISSAAIEESAIDDSVATLDPVASWRAGRQTSAPRPRRWRYVVAMAAAAAVVIAVGVTLNLGSTTTSNTAWAAPLVEFAQRSPLLLMDDPAWRVTRADEYGDEGEMTFANGDRNADLHWRQGPLNGWLEDRRQSSIEHGPHEVANGTATVMQYTDSNDYTALWEAGKVVLEFRTVAGDPDEFQSLLDRLEVVSIDTWLSAMPDSVLKQADQPTAVSDMLAGIPLPDGFDRAARPVTAAQVTDRYQLGARVVGAVSCAWIEQWLDAVASGDEVAAQAAVAALATSSQWPIIQEMNQSGAYGQVLQGYVDAITTNRPVPAGRPVTIKESYRVALGCDQS